MAGVSTAMNRIIKQVRCCADDNECCPNFYYFHFLSQVRMYYPGAREKMEEIFRKEHELWRTVIQKAKDSGEIKQDTDVKKTAPLFRQVFLGMSYEQSFLNGLDVEELKEKFDCLYSLLKA